MALTNLTIETREATAARRIREERRINGMNVVATEIAEKLLGYPCADLKTIEERVKLLLGVA